MSEATYIVCAAHAWNAEIFQRHLRPLPGRWHLVTRPEDLSAARVRRAHPRFLFFLHWSWRVPAMVLQAAECVGFHMSDLPYGRGGSPLQHVILRGRRRTQLTAFRLTEALDAGPIYAQAPLSLEGTAQAIYERASRLAARLIARLIRRPTPPVPQRGRAVVFARRTPAQSRIPRLRRPEGLYDFIRMLDADGYPRAFLVHGGFRYEFRDARYRAGALEARVRIAPATGAA